VKGRFALIGTLALLIAGMAQAKTLEEILKEKGVITEQEAKDAQKLVTYKPGAGFSLFSGDEFSLTLGGRIQAQYEYFAKDMKNLGGGAQTANGGIGPGATQDTSSFRVRRGYLWFRGYAFTKDLTYMAMPDVAVPNVADIWVNYKFMDEAQLTAGQFILPFTRQEINSSGTLQFIDRSIVTDFYKPSYDLGAMAWGKIMNGMVNWNVSASNGTGQNTRRTGSPNNAYTVRLAVNPLGDFAYTESDVDYSPNPLVSVAGSFYANKLLTTNDVAAVNAVDIAGKTVVISKAVAGGLLKEANAANFATGFLGKGVGGAVNDVLDFNMFEVDAAFKWMGIAVQGEYIDAKAKGKATSKELKSNGFYVQGGYTVLPKTLELVARYSALDPNTDSAVTHDKRTEIAGGVNYYFAKHAWKVQASVYSIKNEAGVVVNAADPTKNIATTDLRMQLQAQLIF
jgi:phosphate-selective porin OprO/OprP